MRAVKEVAQASEQGTVGKMASGPARFNQFLKDVRGEMRNVTWPNRDDVRSTTVTVVITTFFFGYYLGMALNIPYSNGMEWLLQLGRTLVQ
jgi:preprotein translocase SecE subunit